MSIIFLPYKKIAEEAKKFLAKYHPEDKVPIPIEDIIEFDLKFDILPTENLQSNYDTDGFITGDFTSIYVDEYVYKNRPNRYRFTLAHEVGHFVLHKNILKGHAIASVSSWKKYISEIDPKDYSDIEFQGYAFAGLLLVPPHHLKIHFDANLHKTSTLIKQAKNKNIKREDYLCYAKAALSRILAPRFEVSEEVITKRIEYDKLENQIP